MVRMQIHYPKVHVHIQLHLLSARQFRRKCYPWEPCFHESFANAVTAPPETSPQNRNLFGVGGQVTNPTNTALPPQSRHLQGFERIIFLEAAACPLCVSSAELCTGAHTTSGAQMLKMFTYSKWTGSERREYTRRSSGPMVRAHAHIL